MHQGDSDRASTDFTAVTVENSSLTSVVLGLGMSVILPTALSRVVPLTLCSGLFLLSQTRTACVFATSEATFGIELKKPALEGFSRSLSAGLG